MSPNHLSGYKNFKKFTLSSDGSRGMNASLPSWMLPKISSMPLVGTQRMLVLFALEVVKRNGL